VINPPVLGDVAFDRTAIRGFLFCNLPARSAILPCGLCIPLPYPDASSLGLPFLLDVDSRVFDEGPGKSGADHCCAKIFAADIAGGNPAPISVLAVSVA
jgi:hypothetical protein